MAKFKRNKTFSAEEREKSPAAEAQTNTGLRDSFALVFANGAKMTICKGLKDSDKVRGSTTTWLECN